MNTSQRSFGSGELAPALYGRTDLAKYASGLRTCRNFIVNKAGGATTRPGSQFVCPVRDPAHVVRLVKFVYSLRDTFVLEFGDFSLRFVREGVQLQSAGATYELSTPYAASELADLQIVQSGNTLTITHIDHPPYELTRITDTDWTLGPAVFGPTIGAPGNVTKAGGTFDATTVSIYQVTAVNGLAGEESLAGLLSVGQLTKKPTSTAPVEVSWTPVADATSYRVYRSTPAAGPGVYGFIGESLEVTFTDNGITPDVAVQPPTNRALFSTPGNYPSVVGYYQQRRIFANTRNNPNTVWASRSGLDGNFTTSTPMQDDDAVTFTLKSDEVDAIRHVINLGKLVLLTEGAEWLIEGDGNGVLTPSAINPRVGSYNGTAALRPIKVDRHLVYVEALGTAVRQLDMASADRGASFDGADLTLFATHLFSGHTIVDWDWQRTPSFVAWAVREDGVLIGVTYLPEQQMLAWHRHDTDGLIENVCVVPEGTEHRVYLVVNRTINGATKRYIERLATLTDRSIVDSFLEYDGRDAGAATANTMTLSGGAVWDSTELLTITASGAVFTPAEIGNAIHLHGADGTLLRFLLTAYTSATVMQGYAEALVPATIRGVAVAEWDRAVDVVSGLDHIDSEDVAVFADEFVVASPNNAAIDALTVHGGTVTLDRPYAHIRVGLPYLCDLETLDIDRPAGSSMKESRMAIGKLGVILEESRGLWAGGEPPTDDDADPLDGLTELKVRENEAMSDPPTQISGDASVAIQNTWNSHGRVFIRQVDPVPLTVLAVIPMGFVPGGA